MARPLLNTLSMRLVIAALALGLFGCAESQLDELPPVQATLDLRPPTDGFWRREAADEATRPIPERPRSISLGYVGNTPLTGGVMRDTPMPVYLPYPVPAPCSCAVQRPIYVSAEE